MGCRHLRLELSVEAVLHLETVVAALGARAHRIVRVLLVVLALQRGRLSSKGPERALRSPLHTLLLLRQSFLESFR